MAKKVLIVDDEEDIRIMLKQQFVTSGYEVVTACDGQEGLAVAQKEMPDIIILDEMMPKMDGYKMAGLLKSDMRFNKIPIIMFSARAEDPQNSLSKEIGVDMYLTKLVDFQTILQNVEQLVQKAG